MRDFGRTPEPAGDSVPEPEPEPEPGDGVDGRFVVQEHHATALHWDLRLERDGVLASWAVPKGIPPTPVEDHLAVHTEDHPLSYLDFSGAIPEGEYGGGLMRIWDSGTYRCHKWSDREVMITLHGGRSRGRHVLFHTGGRNWMLHRMDPPEDPSREPMPEGLRPVAATTGPLPDDQPAWSFEAAVGGRRVLAASEGGRLRILGETGTDVTGRWPELRALGRALGTVAVVVEGELVVTGAGGRPDPAAVDRRDAATGAAAARLAARTPGLLLAADVVWLEGHPTTALAFSQRRRLLERLELRGPAWQTTPAHPGEGSALLAASRQQGLAGVRGRLIDGPYDPMSIRFTPA